jgi:hypothetical protein
VRVESTIVGFWIFFNPVNKPQTHRILVWVIGCSFFVVKKARGGGASQPTT